MERKNADSGKARPTWDTDHESIEENLDQPGRTRYSSKETLNGREGFTGSEDLSDRGDFTARENVTEQRQDMAIGQNEPAGKDVERESLGEDRDKA